MKKLYFLLLVAMLPTVIQAQMTVTQNPTGVSLPGTAANAIHAWYRGGNTNSPTTNNIFGTFWNSEVHHYTNGIWRFSTTTNFGLNNSNFNATPTLTGDGISIRNNGSNSAAFASIDLFTANSNSTALRMGRAFLLQTANSRTEQIGNYNGFWYNVTNVYPGFTPRYVWNINQTEYGRLSIASGNPGRWRFGPNPLNQDAGNRVEIFSAVGDPYFPNASGLRLRNLLPTSPIVPNGTNGVNSNKVLTVDNNGDVVLTAPASPSIAADNGLQVTTGGIVQLGGLCGNNTEIFNARLQSDRLIDLAKRSLFFRQPSGLGFLANGRIGIGDIINCTIPGNLVEITKTASAGSPLGLSGLRLGDLRAGAAIQPANGKALSVDANGDVILVNAPASTGSVNICGFVPIDNVVKHIGGNVICATNITDLAPGFGTVGINQTAPNDGLDVSPPAAGSPGTGDIDVTSATNRYEINDKPVLWHKGNVNDVFVGVGAGFNSLFGNNNTMLGHDAGGNAIGLGGNNTYLGAEAGMNANVATDFTFVGYRAGAAHPGQGVTNTFVGAYAGESETGAENVFVGWKAGQNPGGGYSLHNTFVGNSSGAANIMGNSNSFVGFNTGLSNISGNQNTLLGDFADVGGPSLTNATAIGSGAVVPNNNQMILGNNSVFVGIGLSGAPVGPSNKLEIDAGINGMLPSPAGPGASGLRFRDLKSNATTVPNPGPGVLSVNTNGDVIYVPGGSSTGNVSMCTTTPPPPNNVVKATSAPNVICQTNIYDLYPNGSVGINITTPNDALDVSPGFNSTEDIDITSATGALQINDKTMLHHKASTDAIFLGVNAGAAITPGPNVGINNTVLGADAHSTFTSMGQNSTFVGFAAGQNTGFLNNSTYIGCDAGANNAVGADENTVVGWRAGYNNSGLHNVFIGNLSGHNNNGFQNTFVGIGSGFNGGGAFNVSIGGGSGPFNNTISNSVSIGNGVNTRNSDQMLLGDNVMRVGIGLNGDIPGPQTKLEIDAGINGTSPSTAGPGASGLRFRDLKSNATTVPNPGPGLLAVDASGDVIYVPSPTGGGSGVGNYCGTVPNPLTGPYEVPLNNNDYLFRDDATNTDHVGIGYNCSSILPGKLSVITAFPTNATPFSYTIHGINNNTTMLSTNTGVYGESDNLGLSTDAYGVWGKALNSSRRNIGVFGQGGSNIAGNTFGGYFESMMNVNNLNTGVYAEASNSSMMNVGVQGLSNPALYTFGGIFDAISFSNTFNCIGVTGRGFNFGSSAIPSYPFGSRIGVYGQTQFAVGDFAGYFDGDVFVNGPVSSLGYLISSDRKFKKNISGISNSLDLIMKLKPVTYDYKTDNTWGMQFDKGKQYGFIAQEVEEVIPELVKEQHKPAMVDKNHKTITEAVDYKAVNYDGLVPVLVKAVQELQEQNEKQNELIQSLTEKIQTIASSKTIPSQQTTLGDGNVIILDQNVPNPFSDKTVITYTIPEHAQTAYIHFYTSDGKLIQKSLLSQKGRGELVVYAGGLSNGTYTYTLVVDGKTIDSKRMTLNH